jgi:predicted nuclease with TOPRIM domain
VDEEDKQYHRNNSSSRDQEIKSMSNNQHIEKIEGKLNLLLGKIKNLKKENENLRKELEIKKNEQVELKDKINQYTMKLSLQTPDNSSISKESRLELEKKINGYIKEIDKCIALLGDQG